MMNQNVKNQTPLFNSTLSPDDITEISTLDYILTFNYTENFDKDLHRYKQLSEKRNQSKNP